MTIAAVCLSSRQHMWGLAIKHVDVAIAYETFPASSTCDIKQVVFLNAFATLVASRSIPCVLWLIIRPVSLLTGIPVRGCLCHVCIEASISWWNRRFRLSLQIYSAHFDSPWSTSALGCRYFPDLSYVKLLHLCSFIIYQIQIYKINIANQQGNEFKCPTKHETCQICV